MVGKKEGINEESSYSKKNKSDTSFKHQRKHSRYTPSTNQSWEEKEEGSTDESSYSQHKIKETQVSIIKENHSRYTPPTNQGWEEKNRGVLMKAAIQNTK